jgi:Ca2+-binding RTX toxin-like protein
VAAADTINGTEGNNVLVGTDNDDTVIGKSSTDSVFSDCEHFQPSTGV